MIHLDTFQSFGMQRHFCDRCGKSTGGKTTMSIFNEDVICMECKEDEKNDPEYGAACEAEIEAISRGDYNFKGIFPNYKPIPKR